MKKFCIVLLAVWCIGMSAFSQGINFENLDFRQVLDKATTEKKLVFVDCYTKWCGMCKVMDDRVFPLKETGDFFNPRFVSTKINMEVGEGIGLKEKYGVIAFPTFLILTSEGELLYKFMGKHSPEDFLARMEYGLRPENSMITFEEEFQSGKMKIDRMIAYTRIFQESFDYGKTELLFTELEKKAKLKDKMTEAYWTVFSHTLTNPVDLKKLAFVVNNRTRLIKHIGEEQVNNYLSSAYKTILNNYLKADAEAENGKEELSLIRQQLQNITDFEDRDNFLLQAEAAMAMMEKDVNKIFELYEDNLELLVKSAFIPFYKAFEILDTENKEEMSRAFILGNQAYALAADKEERKKLETVFERYKKLSCVGVFWEELSLEQAMNLLKYNKKMLLVNYYIPQNEACEYMNEQVFTQEETGDLLNRDFLSIKMDMGKTEAKEIAEKYHITTHPTFLILDENASVIQRLEGKIEAAEFIQIIKNIF